MGFKLFELTDDKASTEKNTHRWARNKLETAEALINFKSFSLSF